MSFWGTFFQPLHIQIRHHVLKDHSTSIRCSYPIYAIGGINEHSIYKMPPGFKGICAISYFNNASLEEIKQLRKEWSTHA